MILRNGAFALMVGLALGVSGIGSGAPESVPATSTS